MSGGAIDGPVDRKLASTVSTAWLLADDPAAAVRLNFVAVSFSSAAASTICVDLLGLLALRLSPSGRTTAWCFRDSIEPPAAQNEIARPSAARDDATRAEIEAAAVSDFAAEGGHNCGGGGGSGSSRAVAEAWRAVFIRRRLLQIVRGARSALQGERHDSADAAAETAAESAAAGDGGARRLIRKKDAPDPTDAASVKRFVAAQAEQAALSKRRLGRSQRKRLLVADANQPLPGGVRVWEASSAAGVPAFQHPLRQGSPQPHHPLRRAVVDGLCSAHECAHAIGVAVLGVDGGIDYDSPKYNGEATLVVSPLSAIPPFLGRGGRTLVSILLWRVLSALRAHFEEARPLYVSGAILTRLQPPPSRSRHDNGGGDRYDYDVAHVDRANVSSYDYSAVLYLNGKVKTGQEGNKEAGTQAEDDDNHRDDHTGGGFSGGDFCFVDEESDEVVEPRAGRCVLFPSGFEQLHRVCRVDGGTRFALAAWFTLDEKSSDGPVEEAQYEVVDPVPPPSKEEAEAAAVNIDELRAKVERKMEMDREVQTMYGLK